MKNYNVNSSEIKLNWSLSAKSYSTVKSESIHSVGFGFSSISPSNLGQISKSGTVLKS